MTQITGHSQTSGSVLRIACHLILGGITNKSPGVCKSHIRWSGSVALVVGNDLHSIVLPHTNAAWFLFQKTLKGHDIGVSENAVYPQIAICTGKIVDNALELGYRDTLFSDKPVLKLVHKLLQSLEHSAAQSQLYNPISARLL